MKEEHKNTINTIIHRFDGMINKLEDIVADEYNACNEIKNEDERKAQERNADMLDDIIMNLSHCIFDLEDLIKNR